MAGESRIGAAGEALPASDGLGFLVTDLARLFRNAFQEHVAGTGLTLAEARALVQVARSPGVSQAELADRLEIRPITVARLVAHLVSEGLVERQADPRDGRAYRVFVTPAAEPFLAGVGQVGEELRSVLFTGLDSDQAAATAAALRVMRDNLVRHRAARSE